MLTQSQTDTYRDWRDRANAYLAHHEDVARWCTAYVLGTLRHSPAGARLWAEAREHSFWGAA